MESAAQEISAEAGRVYYETPLNERMRTMLRLEHMFAQIEHSMDGTSHWDTRYALAAFFETFSVIARNEFKSELLQELDRHFASLSRLAEMPDVDPGALTRVLDDLGTTREALLRSEVISQQVIRQNEFLNAIQQRSSIPGGTCNFDLPAMHYWLEHNDPDLRKSYISEWWKPLRPLRDGICVTLRLLRQSAEPVEVTAEDGYYEMELDKATPTQLIRIGLDRSANVYPEVSGGRHRFSVRFLEQPNPNARATKATWDISFALARCAI